MSQEETQTRSEKIEEMREAAHKWYPPEGERSEYDDEDIRDIDEILDML